MSRERKSKCCFICQPTSPAFSPINSQHSGMSPSRSLKMMKNHSSSNNENESTPSGLPYGTATEQEDVFQDRNEVANLEYGLDNGIIDTVNQPIQRYTPLHQEESCLQNTFAKYVSFLTLAAIIFITSAYIYYYHNSGIPMLEKKILPHYSYPSRQTCQVDFPLFFGRDKFYKMCNNDDQSQSLDSRQESQYMKLYTDLYKYQAECNTNTEKLKMEINKIITKLQRLEEILKLNIPVPVIQNEKSLVVISESSIRKIVYQELSQYDADKLGLPDYALESTGGSILATPDTMDFGHNTWISLWGIGIFKASTNQPRNIIQSTASIQPGNCWSFQGSRGKVVIQLAHIIYITAVTMEHISPQISPTGNINSAPKDFAVFGLKYNNGDKISLGYFTYDKNGPTRQTFQVLSKIKPNAVFQRVELAILSNNGNPEYTCIYRFRVHGELYSPSVS